MKSFCISGPVIFTDHYFLSHRLDWAQLQDFIEKKFYFVLHAPRQSGKTTAIKEFVAHLNEEAKYAALYVNIEAGQAARDHAEKAILVVLSSMRSGIARQLPEHQMALSYLDKALAVPTSINLSSLQSFLEFWASNSEQPIALFIDEIDSLTGDSLLSVLRQIRSGFDKRPQGFPQSLCLIGLRDVRDYRIMSKDGVYLSTSSPFNIKAASITIANFSPEQVLELMEQHTQEYGQLFSSEAVDYIFELTQGQPWLVNALAYQACFHDVTDREKIISKEVIERAKDALILRRDTHLDSLGDKLKEPRVRAIIDAIVSGKIQITDFPEDDLQYVTDLGLIKASSMEIANPIYQEVIPRQLAYVVQRQVSERSIDYVNDDGSLNMNKLLEKFSEFYRENSEIWMEKFEYKESGPHLLLMAFLQRVINGGGSIHREYALGRKRVDLLVTFGAQKIVIELKIRHLKDSLRTVTAQALEQTAEYMDIKQATEGHLIIFDQDTSKSWRRRIYAKSHKQMGKTIRVWGM